MHSPARQVERPCQSRSDGEFAYHGVTRPCARESDFPKENAEIEGREIDDAELTAVGGKGIDIDETARDVHNYCGWPVDVECGAFFGVAILNPCGAARD